MSAPLTAQQWADLRAGLKIAAARYRLSAESLRMATQAAKDRPAQAWRCYAAILRSFGAAK